MKHEFKEWMRRRGAQSDTAYNDAIHLERDYGDLEIHYDSDGFREIRRELDYDAGDRASRRENPSRMKFQISAVSGTAEYFKRLSQNLSNYRSVLKKYEAFLKSLRAADGGSTEGLPLPDAEQAIPDMTASEGERRLAKAIRIERRSKLSRAAKASNRKQNDGVIRCAGCDLSDEDGALFDVHHTQPLSLGSRETTADDLVVLCPTCHRITHVKGCSKYTPLSVEALRDLLARSRSSGPDAHRPGVTRP